MTARPRPDVRVACPLCRSRIVAESGERGIVLAEHPIPGGATCAGSGRTYGGADALAEHRRARRARGEGP